MPCKCHVYIVMFIYIYIYIYIYINYLYSKNKDNNFLKNGFGGGCEWNTICLMFFLCFLRFCLCTKTAVEEIVFLST